MKKINEFFYLCIERMRDIILKETDIYNIDDILVLESKFYVRPNLGNICDITKYDVYILLIIIELFKNNKILNFLQSIFKWITSFYFDSVYNSIYDITIKICLLCFSLFLILFHHRYYKIYLLDKKTLKILEQKYYIQLCVENDDICWIKSKERYWLFEKNRKNNWDK